MGKPFTVITDCEAIAGNRMDKQLNPRVARWWLKLMSFDFQIVHRSGTKMNHVDALSRNPVEEAVETDVASLRVCHLNISEGDWLATMQRQDEKLANIASTLQRNEKTKDNQQLFTDYDLQKHRLYRKTAEGSRWVVPQAVVWRVVKGAHDDVGHFGLDKTLERVKATFWFPRMRQFIRKYIIECVECCYNKAKAGKPEGELHYRVVDPTPFATVHLDHLGPFKKSLSGNTHIIVLCDAFTKYVVVKAIRSTKTRPVLKFLCDLSTYFGTVHCIVSDRGTAFTSKLFASYCQEHDIRHVKNAVRTPRANGQVERQNGTILSALRTLTAREDRRDWDQHLTAIQWSINTMGNATTKYSPHELLFNYRPRDILANRMLVALQSTDPGTSVPEDVSERREDAKANIESAQQQWKQRYDLRRRSPTVYQVDDMVVVEREPVATGESRKLDPKYKGPYLVAKVLPHDRYVVCDVPGVQRTQKPLNTVYSADKMKPWCALSPDQSDGDASDESTDDKEDEEGKSREAISL